MYRQSELGVGGAEHEAKQLADNVLLTKLDELVNWGRKFSMFQYPFVTACCAMEYMSVNSPQHDLARYGCEVPRFTPRQADLLMVVGTVTHKNAPILRRVYEQMAEPRWVIAFGACASTGGFYDNYATVPGIDHVIPVDVYIPGCPPRPEQVLDAIQLLMDKIASTPAVLR
ncbi:MAG: NADH-quinone oxidoreductase subunit NuoB [Deltaproteobacteria bacterium]|nr:NADH-quinone oxidoreductase subunit NuoB [Deltaproteobacteria bacterium]